MDTQGRATEQVTLHTVAEAAETLRCSRRHIYDLISAGRLRAVQIGLRRPYSRIRSDDLQALIESQTRSTA